jgi:23S rRNA pseudouridine1911/1915/1917 synthase
MDRESYIMKVDPSKAGVRLDVFLAGEMKRLTRARIQRLIDGGQVLLNGKGAKASHKVKKGDSVTVDVPPPVRHDVEAEDIPLNIIYEDVDIVVVNKSADMVVHPAHGNWKGTLVNALLAHCKDLSGIGGELKPGIVHRLDRGTSGVIVAAKNDGAHVGLCRQFKDRKVLKIYRALVFGSVKKDAGVIDSPIGRSVRDRKKFSAHTSKGRTARTQWSVAKRFNNDLTLLEIRLHTGRTHQIRVHFAEAGHPLVGDTVYGSKGQLKRVADPGRRKIVEEFHRPALHAAKLGFEHPGKGTWMEFEAPLPEDLEELLKRL